MSDNNYLVLSRKWRPQSFDDVVGQIHVTRTLQNALIQNRLGHGYLFTGSRGIGKTSVARILSRAVNCIEGKNSNPCNKCPLCIDILKGNNFDVIELDGATNRGIDEIRELRESIKYPPTRGKYKIYIIDEVHMLTKEAFNALLKTLEEPPPHIIFILATTDPHKIPQTILSRTQRFNFKRISVNEINNYLSKILKAEKKIFDDACLKLIAKKADGSMRDALSLLDQVIAYCDDDMNIKNVSEAIGLIDSVIYSQILFFIIKSDLSKIVNKVNESINSGHSINDFISGFVDFLNRCVHYYLDNNSKDEIFFDNDVQSFLAEIQVKIEINLIINLLELTIAFQNQLKFISQPMIALESHFIKLAYISKKPDIEINNAPDSKDSDGEDIKKQSQKKNDSIQDTEEASNNQSDPDNKLTTNNKPDETLDVNEEASKDNDIIDLDYIKSKWDSILTQIEKESRKTASFLSEALISEYNDNNLILTILNGSQFHINSLENDVDFINKIFSNLLKVKINIKFRTEDSNNKDLEKEEKPKQHPLLSKAIDLLDGEVI